MLISAGVTRRYVDSIQYTALLCMLHCSPSVMDRLNCLLEPGGYLSVDERGVVGDGVPIVRPHPEFR